jgi:hypothetical protein
MADVSDWLIQSRHSDCYASKGNVMFRGDEGLLPTLPYRTDTCKVPHSTPTSRLYHELCRLGHDSVCLDLTSSFRAFTKSWMARDILGCIKWWLLNVLPLAVTTRMPVLDIQGFVCTAMNGDARLCLVSK